MKRHQHFLIVAQAAIPLSLWIDTMNRCWFCPPQILTSSASRLALRRFLSVALSVLAVQLAQAQSDDQNSDAQKSDGRDSSRSSGVVLSATDAPAPIVDGVGRVFPADVKRGVMVVTASPEVTLNGKPDRLSPGSRIRGLTNLVMTPSQLTGLRFVVNFRRGIGGELTDVWLLTADEAKVKLPDAEKSARSDWFGLNPAPAKDDGKTDFDKLPKWDPSIPR